MAKTAVITGITGQDGAYLAEHLLALGYKVIGAFRRTSSVNFWRLAELGLERHDALALVEHDLTDLGSNIRLLQQYQPDEIYNLAAQSYVAVSFTQPFTTASITGSGPLNVLEAIRLVNNSIRFYQASSSEQYGKVQATPQDESTPFYPRSPYAAAKLFAHWLSINYREAYGLFAVTGILFNHESPLRGKEFVTRKITDGVARIKLGMQETLELGNLNALRDWGFAREYVQGMHLMMQHQQPDSFVLATGRNYSVRQFVVAAFDAAGMKVEWKGRGADEVGLEARTGKIRVRVNPAYFRPAEVEVLLGNPAKAKAVLGWEAKTTLEELAQHMVAADVRRNERGLSF